MVQFYIGNAEPDNRILKKQIPLQSYFAAGFVVTRYAASENQRYGDVIEYTVIPYTTFEDNAVHSCTSGRAALDQSLGDSQYSTAEGRFEHIEDYIN